MVGTAGAGKTTVVAAYARGLIRALETHPRLRCSCATAAGWGRMVDATGWPDEVIEAMLTFATAAGS
jgi:hypothetical protein